MDNLISIKKNIGHASPKELLVDNLRRASKWKSCLILWETHDDQFGFHASDISLSQCLGLIEFCKAMIFEMVQNCPSELESLNEDN